MNLKWILIESLAVMIESSAHIYFIDHRFTKKTANSKSAFPALVCFIIWGLLATFLYLPFYDIILFSIMFIYIFTIMKEPFWQKLFGIVLIWGVSLGTSLAGAGLASIAIGTSIEYTIIYQEDARFLAIILIKALQVVIFYILSKKHFSFRNIKTLPTLILIVAAVITWICLIFLYSNIPLLGVEGNSIATWLALGLLLLIIVVFTIYELFVKEESRNIELNTRLQRLELESRFFAEIDTVYSDIRQWRHDYFNNMTALRSLVENGLIEQSLNYIDNIADVPIRAEATLQTGNLVLDSVVSSKLWLAQSLDIQISIHAVYPEGNLIDANDLCAIAGNLLDNAIEACQRMTESDQPMFIHFSLLVKGKNLVLSIKNSFNGELKRDGDKFLTVKQSGRHGMGLSYVESIVAKYHGIIKSDGRNGVFETHVILPFVSANELSNSSTNN
ncbi:MAG: GHKL domain-containing protein [Oscillospiraceae bacterium]|nr:GHKL domain-containing protein [Oscillospiraceae bacterium]